MNEVAAVTETVNIHSISNCSAALDLEAKLYYYVQLYVYFAHSNFAKKKRRRRRRRTKLWVSVSQS